MKSKNYSLLCFFIIAAIGLFIESSVWSPHLLQGKEILKGGAPDCDLGSSCEPNDCPSHCSGDNHETCSGSGGSATEGCYEITVLGMCGTSSDPDENCHAVSCSGCSKC